MGSTDQLIRYTFYKVVSYKDTIISYIIFDFMDKYATVKVLLVLSLILLIALFMLKGLFKNIQPKCEGNSTAQRINAFQPYLLLFFGITFMFCVIVSTSYYTNKFLPFPAAKPYTDIISLFSTTTIATGTAFLITQILLFFFAFRFRSSSGRKASYIKGSSGLELLWTIAPAIVFVSLFLWGQTLWNKIINVPPGEVLEIEVMAEQFNWKTKYPGKDKKAGKVSMRFISATNDMGIDKSDPNSRDDFIPLQMHVPKNRPVRLLLRSKDVIHSFYLPQFRTKMDAVPGMITTLSFTAIYSTQEMREKLHDPDFNYEVACAELCGRMHFAMKLILVVDESAEFERWASEQKSWISQQADDKTL